jgi:hypothetical protein
MKKLNHLDETTDAIVKMMKEQPISKNRPIPAPTALMNFSTEYKARVNEVNALKPQALTARLLTMPNLPLKTKGLIEQNLHEFNSSLLEMLANSLATPVSGLETVEAILNGRMALRVRRGRSAKIGPKLVTGAEARCEAQSSDFGSAIVGHDGSTVTLTAVGLRELARVLLDELGAPKNAGH